MFPIIEVSCSARNRGRIHGAQARSRIDQSVATFARLFAFCGIDWPGAQKLGAGYRDLIGDLAPELLEEIEGFAAGSDRHVNQVLALKSPHRDPAADLPGPAFDRRV
jgi:isopenicillin-N N-acyltransferase-like protein